MDKKECAAQPRSTNQDQQHYDALTAITDTSQEFLHAAFKNVAYHGYTKCMRLLKQRGATNFDDALILAVHNEQLGAVKMLYELGVLNIELASMLAGQLGRHDILKYLHRIGATLEEALCKAVPSTMQFCIDLGVAQDVIDKIAAHITIEGDTKRFEVMLNAQPTNIDALAAVASIHNQTEILILLHYRATFDHAFALYYAVQSGNYDLATLIAEWGADPCDAMDYAVNKNDITAMLFTASLPGWNSAMRLDYISKIATPEQLVCILVCWL